MVESAWMGRKIDCVFGVFVCWDLVDRVMKKLVMKLCDSCGMKFSGKSFPMHDENHNKQKGLIQCEECFKKQVL